jgi:hypothetical protein
MVLLKSQGGCEFMTKERLKAYRALKFEISQLENELLEYLDSSFLGNTTLNGVVKNTGVSDITSKLAIETLQLYGTLNEKRLKAIRMCREIEDCIDRLDPLERVLMRERYILCKDWEEVCCVIGYSWRQTHKFHSRILIKIIK